MGDVASPQEARRVQAVRQAVAGPPLPQDRAKVSIVETVTSHREDEKTADVCTPTSEYLLLFSLLSVLYCSFVILFQSRSNLSYLS